MKDLFIDKYSDIYWQLTKATIGKYTKDPTKVKGATVHIIDISGVQGVRAVGVVSIDNNIEDIKNSFEDCGLSRKDLDRIVY